MLEQLCLPHRQQSTGFHSPRQDEGKEWKGALASLPALTKEDKNNALFCRQCKKTEYASGVKDGDMCRTCLSRDTFAYDSLSAYADRDETGVEVDDSDDWDEDEALKCYDCEHIVTSHELRDWPRDGDQCSMCESDNTGVISVRINLVSGEVEEDA
jgi:Zn finger protein HypA/HybF involved in hydrogenase expression